MNKHPLALSPQKLALLKTLREQKNAHTSLPAAPSGSPPHTLRQRADQQVFPLSSAQRTLWFDALLAFEDSLDHISAAWRLSGDLDVERLRQSLQKVMQRHPLLRCIFPHTEGEPRQQWHASLDVDLTIISLSHLHPSEREQQCAYHLKSAQAQPFDLAHGPLLRAHLLGLSSTSFVFQLTLHPLIADYQSLLLLLQDLAYFYTSYNTDKATQPATDLTPPLQYADYAVWQSSWLSSAAPECERTFWRQHLASLPSRLDLPLEIILPSDLSRSSHEHFAQDLPLDLSQQLVAFCEQAHIAPATLFQATWLALLHRYTGQAEIVLGQYMPQRQPEEVAAIIGPFATFLPVVHYLSHRLTLMTLLEQLHATNSAISAHQSLPPGQILSLVSPEKQATLMQTTFAAIRSTLSPALFTGLSLQRDAVTPPVLPDAPGLCIHEESQQYMVILSYPGKRFSAATIRRFSAHYLTLLAHLLAHPQQSIAQGELLTSAERQQLLVFANHASAQPEHARAHQSIHRLFEMQVTRTPTAIALIEGEKQMSYHELDARANQLARILGEQHIQAEMTVGIALERSCELIISLLAVLKSGAAYVPLDPINPPERLAYYIQNAQITLIVTQSPLLSQLPPFPGTVLCMDRDAYRISQASTELLHQEVDPYQLAYIIYTSGSTGLPKGAMNAHAAVCNRLQWMQTLYQLGPHERFLQKTPYSFDVSVGEIFCPLISGACLVLAEPGGHKDPAYLARIVEQEAITTLHFVPSMLGFFLEEPLIESHCTSLRRVMCSGEALSPALQERFFQSFPAVELHNLYGPTEAAVEVSFWNCQRGTTSIPIGRPINRVALYVLDACLQLVPAAVPGELYIGGIQVGRGYFQQADRTAEVFIPDPFGNGTRLYKTGDLVRMRTDGVIEFLGRRDQQIKIAGHRIELGEIELLMLQSPLVTQAVALVREDVSPQKQLVAYLVPDLAQQSQYDVDNASRFLIAQMRTYLQTHLPDYMVPTVFVVLPTLPLTLSGKLDKRALPAPEKEHARLQRSQDFVAPRDQVEQLLTEIVLELLPVAQPGIHDNLFELGANSLSALQLLVRLRQRLQINLTLKNVFQSPTIAGLASLVEQQGIHPIPTSTPLPFASIPLTPAPRDQPLPLSFAQQRLWFLDQLYPNQVSYLIPLVLRLRGSLQVRALRQSLYEIIWRHDALRTIIQNEHGQPRQKILPSLAIPLLLHDLHLLPANEREQQIHHWIKQETQTPFDLARGPLLRLRLLRLQAEEHILLVTMHHIVSDGWSIAVMWKEIVTLYNAFASGKPSPLPPLSLQYADFAVWQRQWLQEDALNRQLAYWQEQLYHCPDTLRLPLDHPRPDFQTFTGRIRQFQLSTALSARLRHLSQTLHATLFMLLLTAFNVLLTAITGQTDLVVGTPVANRNWVEVEPLIGFFVNTLALRTNLSGNPSFLEALQRVRETTLGAYEHQDVPFEQVVEAIPGTRDTSRSPLFQVFFTLQNLSLSSMELTGLQIEPLSSTYQVAKFDLTLGFSEDETGLAGAFEYNSMLFEPETIATLQFRLLRLLEMVVEQPTRQIDALIAHLHTSEEQS